jgi:two-component system, cell cycle response regulator DivK
MSKLLQGKTIFLVEDNLHNRVIFQMSLIRHGALIEFERWGREAVPRLKRMMTIDVIILDLMLPDGVTGFDLFTDIRRLPQYATTPIVAITAMDPAVAMRQARAQGFSGFIAKPIDDRLFAQQIERVINGEQVWYTGERYIL